MSGILISYILQVPNEVGVDESPSSHFILETKNTPLSLSLSTSHSVPRPEKPLSISPTPFYFAANRRTRARVKIYSKIKSEYVQRGDFYVSSIRRSSKKNIDSWAGIGDEGNEEILRSDFCYSGTEWWRKRLMIHVKNENYFNIPTYEMSITLSANASLEPLNTPGTLGLVDHQNTGKLDGLSLTFE